MPEQNRRVSSLSPFSRPTTEPDSDPSVPPPPWLWGIAGLVTGVAGLASSHASAMLLSVRESPLVAVAELVIRLTPGDLAERAIQVVGHWDKPLLLAGVLTGLALCFWVAGRTARGTSVRGLLVFLVLGMVGMAAVLTDDQVRAVRLVPVLVGIATWLAVLPFLTDRLRRHTVAGAGGEGSRREFLVRAGIVLAGAAAVAGAGQLLGRGRRRVEEARRLLKLPVSTPEPASGTDVGVAGVAPWRTPNAEFYQVHTAFVPPSVDPTTWRLRIHGMVERELELTYADLLDRQLTEAWITLNCVSNPVGGDLIGNAWWSGVRIAPILKEVGVRPEADAVLQTSEDGWTCATPISVLSDGRDAMLAIGMNGEPLPVEHGFPVRMIVPGLYGFVSATKWLVDLEVTRFRDVSAFWTERGWAEQAPVKLASRIDVPRDDAKVPAGELAVGGVAWSQHTGIRAVEYSLDGGAWTEAELGQVPSTDTWVQWAATVTVAAGAHELRVRAVDANGRVQTGVERYVMPDGATGWHSVEFRAE